MTHDTTAEPHRNKVISDLRSFADFLDDHPEIPAPMFVEASVLPRYNGTASTDAEAIAEVERIAAELGITVEVRNGHHTAKIAFGKINFRAFVIIRDTMTPDSDGAG